MQIWCRFYRSHSHVLISNRQKNLTAVTASTILKCTVRCVFVIVVIVVTVASSLHSRFGHVYARENRVRILCSENVLLLMLLLSWAWSMRHCALPHQCAYYSVLKRSTATNKHSMYVVSVLFVHTEIVTAIYFRHMFAVLHHNTDLRSTASSILICG